MSGIGAMRDKVTFKVPTREQQPGGGSFPVYAPDREEWTEVLPYSSQRDLVSDQTALVDGFRFRIRWVPGFVPAKDMLIEYNGRSYAINGIEERHQRRRYWEIKAVYNG